MRQIALQPDQIAAMSEKFSYVPEHMRDAFKLYIERGIMPGSFATAVLTNDLQGAFGKADHINKEHIGSIIAWFYNYAPNGCFGSPEKVKAWTSQFAEAA